jgi:hypothetical protein
VLNSAWTVGTSQTITWNPDSISGSTVSLTLYDNTVVAESISTTTENDGSYSWTPSITLPTGNAYRILIISTTNTSSLRYSDYFTILKSYAGNDLVVKLTWNSGTSLDGVDADKVDVDLHVWNPAGDHCYYGSKTISTGEYLDIDNTWGYGPEVYMVQDAAAGVYTIKVQYYSKGLNITAFPSATIEVTANGSNTTYGPFSMTVADSYAADSASWEDVTTVNFSLSKEPASVAALRKADIASDMAGLIRKN